MADSPAPSAPRRRLDATGSREVVYCHQCEDEWYRDEHGLVCPRCDGEATEIVGPSPASPSFPSSASHSLTIDPDSSQISASNDPRPPEIPFHTRPPAEELEGLRDHNPWQDNDSDPEESDINEFMRDIPGGRTTMISRTFRAPPRQVFASGSSRRQNPNDHASQTIRDFEGMLGGLLGPTIRSDPDDLNRDEPPSPPPAGFPPPTLSPPGWDNHPVTDRSGNENQNQNPPRVFGGRLTFQFGRSPPRTYTTGPGAGGEAQDLNTYAPRPPTVLILVLRGQPNEVSRILRDLMLVMQPPDEDNNVQPNPLMGLHGLFAGLLNPAMAVSGDAVYSQEALDRIISTLMEQHPTSNAPGPASAEAIASLPKKKIDEKMIGPEGKAECSICMDDVILDEEVMILPCKHWFHEVCVKAWLSEHNTCPICRTGVGRDGAAIPAGSRETQNQNQSPTPQDPSADASDERTPQYRRRSTFLRRRPSDNEARLSAIRSTAGVDPALEGHDAEYLEPRFNRGSRRERSPSPPLSMPGTFSSSGSHRNSIFRRRESDTDAGSTGRRERERERERESEARSRNSDRLSEGSGNSGSAGGGLGSWFRRFSGGGSGRRND